MSTPPLTARPSDSRARGPQLTVRGKILTLVAFFAVVAVALGGVAAVQITQITGDAARLARTQATVGTSLTALKDSLWTVRNQVTAVAAYPPSAQKAQVDNLKSALRQLEQKLTEAQAKADLLIAQHRRARAVGKASDARLAIGDGSKAAAFDRMKRKVAHSEALGQAKAEIAGDNMEDRLAALEKEDRIEQLLAELKGKRGA